MSDTNSKIQNLDIFEVISKEINLERNGKDYVGLCPFHDDKKPSLSVSPSKKVFKCFSCNTSGNAFTFIKKFHNFNNFQTLKYLNKNFNLELDIVEPKSIYSKEQKDLIVSFNKFNKIFQVNLKLNKKITSALLTNGYTMEDIQKYKIGFASEENDIVNFINKSKMNLFFFETNGIISKSKDKFYDFFRNRIIFPLLDKNGDCIGFNGRKLFNDNNEKNPKYLLSKSNIVFQKSKYIYNLNNLFKNNFSEVFLVESVNEVIALNKIKIDNAVSFLGSSISESMFNFLKNIRKKIILALDNDSSGTISTIKISQKLLKLGLDFEIIDYKESKMKEKDLFDHVKIKENNLRNIVKHRLTFFAYYLKNYDFSNISSNDSYKLTNTLKIFLSDLIIKPNSIEIEQIVNHIKPLTSFSKRNLAKLIEENINHNSNAIIPKENNNYPSNSELLQTNSNNRKNNSFLNENYLSELVNLLNNLITLKSKNIDINLLLDNNLKAFFSKETFAYYKGGLDDIEMIINLYSKIEVNKNLSDIYLRKWLKIFIISLTETNIDNIILKLNDNYKKSKNNDVCINTTKNQIKNIIYRKRYKSK